MNRTNLRKGHRKAARVFCFSTKYDTIVCIYMNTNWSSLSSLSFFLSFFINPLKHTHLYMVMFTESRCQPEVRGRVGGLKGHQIYNHWPQFHTFSVFLAIVETLTKTLFSVELELRVCGDEILQSTEGSTEYTQLVVCIYFLFLNVYGNFIRRLYFSVVIYCDPLTACWRSWSWRETVKMKEKQKRQMYRL